MFEKIIRPDKISLLPEWAEENIRMPPGDPKEGPYRLAYTPYWREPLYELSPSVRTRWVVIIGPVQTGKSLVGTIFILGTAAISPGPALFISPTREMAATHVELKFDPMVDAMGWDIFPVKKSRQAGNTKSLKKYPGGSISFVGSEEKTTSRSLSMRYIDIDDADGIKGNVGGEGDPMTLFPKRAEHYAGIEKILINSTLKIKSASHGENQYNQSSMGAYNIPCLKCGCMQYMEWGDRDTPFGLKYQVWKDGSIRKTWYMCKGCGGEIEERKKFIWLNKGKYVHKNPDNKYRGFRVHGLMSPPGMALWDDKALEWINAQGKYEALQVFINTFCVESYEHPGTVRLKWEVLKARAEPFRFFEIPEEVFMLSLGVDTHDKRITLTLTGYGKEYESWVLFFGELHGDPNDDFVWAELDKFLARDFPRKDGASLRIANCSVDMGGHRAEAVKLYTRKRFPRVIAVQGARGNLGPAIAPPVTVDITYDGQKIKGGATVWNVNTYQLKTTIYGRYKKEQPGPGYIHFSADLPDEFYKQITAEELKMGLKEGYPKLTWENTRPGKQNHGLDCLVYALAGAMRIMPTIQVLTPLPAKTGENPGVETKNPAPKPIRQDRSGAKRRKKRFDAW
jgi:phage terminase large subunit GpA-like protein